MPKVLKVIENDSDMRTLITILIICSAFLIIPVSVSAQKVFSCDHSYEADVKVFVAKYTYEADLLVYRVKYSYEAGQNDGKWFFCKYNYEADKTIYFCDYSYEADLIICFVDNSYEAKWREKSMQYLMY